MTRAERKSEAEKRRRYQQSEWITEITAIYEKTGSLTKAVDDVKADTYKAMKHNPQQKGELIKAWNEMMASLNDNLLKAKETV